MARLRWVIHARLGELVQGRLKLLYVMSIPNLTSPPPLAFPTTPHMTASPPSNSALPFTNSTQKPVNRSRIDYQTRQDECFTKRDVRVCQFSARTETEKSLFGNSSGEVEKAALVTVSKPGE